MNTATLREPQPIHEVDFHGAAIQIIGDFSYFYLAADSNGEVYFYEESPRELRWRWEGETPQLCFLVAKVDLDGINWRDTAKRYRV